MTCETLNTPYDIIIYSATPSGIACALTAARKGQQVLLVNRTAHIGGFVTSGCGGWEAPYDGRRSPMFTEFLEEISSYYAKAYGEDSPQYRASKPDPDSRDRLGRPRVEPRVAEMVFNGLLNAEDHIRLVTGYVPWTTNIVEAKIQNVTFVSMNGEQSFAAKAAVYVDASYEGDLAIASGANYRLGREGRDEFNEPHAGRIFVKKLNDSVDRPGWPRAAVEGCLNIRSMGHSAGEILSHHESGQADRCVMAYNYRPILTDDPSNRIFPKKPENYEQFSFKGAFVGGFVRDLPNRKVAWNGARLIGPQHAYPEASWAVRLKIEAYYRDFMLSMLWYLQHEADIPAEEKLIWKSMGLAKDEFTDNAHFPHEIYVRESIRIRGQVTFTEHDGLPDPSIGRAPLHTDSIAMTDWPLDSVAVRPDVYEGCIDGAFLMAEQSRPAQLPFGCLLSENRLNLLVPVCLSATHVGFGCLRLEPVWIQAGEAAALAAVQTIRNGQPLISASVPMIQEDLIARGAVLAFYNDIQELPLEEQACIQRAALKGFFPGYDCRPYDALSVEEARVWLAELEPVERLRRLHQIVEQASASRQALPISRLEAARRVLAGDCLTDVLIIELGDKMHVP